MLPSVRLPVQSSMWAEMGRVPEGSKLDTVREQIQHSVQQALKDYAQTVREYERNLPEQLLQALQGTEEVSTEELRDLASSGAGAMPGRIATDQPGCDGKHSTDRIKLSC